MPIPWRKRQVFIKTCEECGAEFPTRKKKSRFCGKSCSAKQKTQSQIDQVAIKCKAAWKAKCNGSTEVESILDLSSRTVSKIFKRLKIGCSHCSWDKAICDVHHINGRKIANADAHENLCYLCPNCHRLAGLKILKSTDLINLKDYIGDKWKFDYYG